MRGTLLALFNDMIRVVVGFIVPMLLAFVVPVAEAEPVAVRHPECTTYGFLALSSLSGETLAHGELVQVPNGERVQSRLTFRFKDGSLSDETLTFSQTKTFRLLHYHLVQRGPSFPEASEVTFDAVSGRYTVRHRSKPGAEAETLEGTFDVPADVYNGMIGTLLKNVPAGTGASGHLLAFTPKPRLVKLALIPTGESTFSHGELARKAARYLVKLELGGLMGVVASILGKDPPDLSYWVLQGDAPAFLKFEGPFFLNGPTWRVELTGPRWPK